MPACIEQEAIVNPNESHTGMTTKHQYLDKYPISPDSEILIVGTIHPHNHHDFVIPFFYGNKLSLWTILSDAFPDDLKKPISLEGVLSFLKRRKISVSDTIRECQRKNPTALDKDLIPVQLNEQLIDQIRNSNINLILLTSGFQKNNAFRLFYADILGQRITPEIRKTKEVTLHQSIFGREVRLNILYSPSGSSNVPLSTSNIYLENKDRFKDSPHPVYDFKVEYYRERFSSI